MALSASTLTLAQNVGINTDGSDPDADALLHLNNDATSPQDATLLRLENEKNGANNLIGVQLFNSATGATSRWSLYNPGGASTDFRIMNNGNDYMTILNGGNVGIGTTTPTGKLHVHGDGVADGGIITRFTSDDDRPFDIYSPIAGDLASPFQLYTLNAFEFLVEEPTGVHSTLNIEYDADVRIESDNNANMLFVDYSADEVGIGTATPLNTLDVNGDVRVSANPFNELLINQSGDDVNLNLVKKGTETVCARVQLQGFGNPATEAGYLQFDTKEDAGVLTTRMGIARDGNVGIGTTVAPTEKLQVVGNILATGTVTPSDRRYKKDITAINNALGLISQFNGYNYNYKTEEFPDMHFDSTAQVGFIAQELQEVLPEVVSEGNTGYLAVDYSKVTPLLLMAIKEQQAIIEAQKKEIIELKAEASTATSTSEANAEKLAELQAQMNTLMQLLNQDITAKK